MKWKVLAVASLFLAAATPTVVDANLLTNGSFETGTYVDNGDGYMEVGAGSTVIPGWTVTEQEIDWVGGYWSASDGVLSLDLSGTPGHGAVSQSFPTTAGGTYEVSFDLAGNFACGHHIKTLEVTAGSDPVRVYTFNTSGKFHTNMGWVRHAFTFVAGPGTTSSVTFKSQASNHPNCGPALDNVVVVNPNVAPDVSDAAPSQGTIWPPNKKMVDITIEGIVDPDGDQVTITILSITSDEAGATVSGVGTSTASLEADRDGRGSGRTYTIEYSASDGIASSTGTVTVVVPHDQGKGKKKGRSKPALTVYPNPANPATSIAYSLPEASHVTVTVFNTLGQQVRQLVNEISGAGDYTVRWNGTDAMGRGVTSGLYLIRFTFDQDQLVRKFLLVK